MTHATIDGAAAARTAWDVVVIGAGPAGSIAALQTARSGARTLLVERKAFPRDKVCGGCLNGRALSLLRSLGLERPLAQLDASPLSEFRVHVGRCSLRLPLPDGMAVSRARFDASLVEAAVAAGAEFLPETSATTGPIDGALRTVTLTHKNHRRETLGAKFVLAADGLGHRCFRPASDRHEDVAHKSRIGLSGIADADESGVEPGMLVMAVGRAGYVGLVRVEDGRLNIAAALDPTSIHRAQNPWQTVAGVLEDAGFVGTRWLAAVSWQGTPPLTRRTHCLARRRLFVLGDAAGYVEPFTGEGMAWAMTSAVEVMPLVLKGLSAWEDSLMTDWAVRYQRRQYGRQRICRALTTLLRCPSAARSVARVLTSLPWLAQPLVQHLNAPSIQR